MKKILSSVIFIFLFFNLNAEENLEFYLNKAIKNNLQLNAEKKSFESAKQKRNISRSEFLPTVTIEGDQSSTTSLNRTFFSLLNIPAIFFMDPLGLNWSSIFPF